MMFKLQFPDPMEENNNSDRCKEDDNLFREQLEKAKEKNDYATWKYLLDSKAKESGVDPQPLIRKKRKEILQESLDGENSLISSEFFDVLYNFDIDGRQKISIWRGELPLADDINNAIPEDLLDQGIILLDVLKAKYYPLIREKHALKDCGAPIRFEKGKLYVRDSLKNFFVNNKILIRTAFAEGYKLNLGGEIVIRKAIHSEENVFIIEYVPPKEDLLIEYSFVEKEGINLENIKDERIIERCKKWNINQKNKIKKELAKIYTSVPNEGFLFQKADKFVKRIKNQSYDQLKYEFKYHLLILNHLEKEMNSRIEEIKKEDNRSPKEASWEDVNNLLK